MVSDRKTFAHTSPQGQSIPLSAIANITQVVGLVLGIGRVIAETAALIFTSGYVE